MMMKTIKVAAACTLLMGASAATADVLAFTGTVTGVSTLIGADATCAPECAEIIVAYP